MHRYMKLLIAALSLVCFMPFAQGQDKPQPDPAKELMQRKLQHAQKVLEGIAVNKFDKISGSAEELIQISKLAEWRATRSPKYESFTMQFRRAAEGLVDAAKDKNVDAAALSYVELTMSCVKCHKLVRETRMTMLTK